MSQQKGIRNSTSLSKSVVGEYITTSGQAQQKHFV